MLPNWNSKFALPKTRSIATSILVINQVERTRKIFGTFLKTFPSYCSKPDQHRSYFHSCVKEQNKSTVSAPLGTQHTPENQDKDGDRDSKTDVLCFNNSEKCFMQPDQQSPVGCFYSVDLSRRLSEKISCRNITYQCTLAAQLPRRIILGQTNKRRESHQQLKTRSLGMGVICIHYNCTVFKNCKLDFVFLWLPAHFSLN